jgi:hypothetical protein
MDSGADSTRSRRLIAVVTVTAALAILSLVAFPSGASSASSCTPPGTGSVWYEFSYGRWGLWGVATCAGADRITVTSFTFTRPDGSTLEGTHPSCAAPAKCDNVTAYLQANRDVMGRYDLAMTWEAQVGTVVKTGSATYSWYYVAKPVDTAVDCVPPLFPPLSCPERGSP